MKLNDYQEEVMNVCRKDMENSYNYTYLSSGIVEELGEVLGKIAKAKRQGKIKVVHDQLLFLGMGNEQEVNDLKKDIAYELGDLLWFLSMFSRYLCIPLEDVAEMNIAKLKERVKNKTIIGNGDGMTKEERL